MKKIFKILKKKGAIITFYKENNKKFVEKKYLNKKDKDLAKREYETINEINNLLKSKGYEENTFNAYTYNNNSLIMDYVDGLPLDKFLLKYSGNKKKIEILKKEFRKLGEIFRIIQEYYKTKDIDKNLFIKKKIFAAAIGNFIYNKTITPLDLGSKNEKIVNLEQVAKFINFLYIMKPWQALTSLIRQLKINKFFLTIKCSIF